MVPDQVRLGTIFEFPQYIECNRTFFSTGGEQCILGIEIELEKLG